MTVLDRGPDVFIWPHDRIGEWVQAGFISAVSPKANLQRDIASAFWQAVQFDGETYGYPVAVEGPTQICNADLVDEPFDTFDAVIDANIPANVKPLMFDYTNVYFSYGMLTSEGGYAFERDGDSYDPSSTGINNFGSRQGILAIKELVDLDLLPKGTAYGEMDNAFKEEKAACVINGPWSWGGYEEAGIDFFLGPYPSVNFGNPKGFLGVIVAVITEQSPNKTLAKQFIEEYVLTVGGLSDIYEEQSLGVATYGPFMDTLSGEARLTSAFEVYSNGEPMPNIPKMARFWTHAQPAISDIVNENQDIQPRLDAAAQRISR
jgi:maltose/maltodextrin transport system substrate-binding protein